MDSTSPTVGYMSMEADALLRTCFGEFGNRGSYEKAVELALRGTIPLEVLESIEQTFVTVDPKGIANRFATKKRIYVDSWSEMVNLGSIAHFYNSIQTPGAPYVATIGIESSYRESSLREKYLSDGAIASRSLGVRQLVQSCLAQNIKGDSAGKSLQQEIIDRLQAKLEKSPDEPTRILAVTVFSETDDFDQLDFTTIAQETMAQYKNRTTYGPIFCIIPSTHKTTGAQILVVPLAEFLPGGSGVPTIIQLNDLYK